MAEVRLIPGNPAPALYKSTAIELSSASHGRTPRCTEEPLRLLQE
jgi:hypothetical protein